MCAPMITTSLPRQGWCFSTHSVECWHFSRMA